ncbi:predicted protein [Sclerotinia sclerotiorum 1980 UF-70]|uniref:Uncharacterized protein n=1 Tax=Sclerotinia sclerotiorum (strain ATCC 18683 / 1980 / Ss-1) TaxID=665079 RepID=A7E4F9_SCLS1|nr:predicted protein [Sclerotinia sclerotiorum 1980 UF-70]EDN90781.1 predicted protein [Sclerotinia sclerotiorum 1980 UF-70]
MGDMVKYGLQIRIFLKSVCRHRHFVTTPAGSVLNVTKTYTLEGIVGSKSESSFEIRINTTRRKVQGIDLEP